MYLKTTTGKYTNIHWQKNKGMCYTKCIEISMGIFTEQEEVFPMREVKAVKINAADFAPYGTFCNMTEPEGYPLSGEIHKFYPDLHFRNLCRQHGIFS